MSKNASTGYIHVRWQARVFIFSFISIITGGDTCKGLPPEAYLSHCHAIDPKNPSRWRPAYLCRETDVPGRKNLKEEILKVCDRRQDNHAEQVRFRVAGIPTDLHAADVRYHVDCKVRFMAYKSVQYAEAAAEQERSNGLAFLAATNTGKVVSSISWTYPTNIQEEEVSCLR